MTDLQQSIGLIVDLVKSDLIASLRAADRYATGSTEKEIEEVIQETIGQLFGPGYIMILEEGRKPTTPGAPFSAPGLLARIQEWCAAKGIEENAAYAITKKIHEKGYAGKPGVISIPLSSENISRRADEVLDALANLLITKLTEAIAA